MAVSPAPRRHVPSAQDLRLLGCLAEQRVAVVEQAAAWLGVSHDAAGRRIRRLHAAGLLEQRRIFDAGSASVRITGAGLAAVGSALPRPGQKLDEHRHDVGVGWLWTAAQAGAFGPLGAVHSERAMRSHDGRRDRLAGGGGWLGNGPGAALGVGMDRPGVGGRHYPDLLLDTAGGRRIAVELELSAKGGRRLDRVMAAYAADHRVAAVLYVVEDPRIGEQVRRAAARAGIAELVQVRGLGPGGIGGAPGRTAAPGRARSRTLQRGAAGRGGQEPPRRGPGEAGLPR